MGNRPTTTLAAIVFRPSDVRYLGVDGARLPAPPRAGATAVAALWDRPSPN